MFQSKNTEAAMVDETASIAAHSRQTRLHLRGRGHVHDS